MFLVNKNFMKRQMYCCSFSERGIVVVSLSNWSIVVHLLMHLTSATCVCVGIIYSVFMNLQKKHGGSNGLSKSVIQVQWCFRTTCQETKPSDTICKNNDTCMVLFWQTRSFVHMQDVGHLYVSDDSIKHLHKVFVHNPRKLTQAATVSCKGCKLRFFMLTSGGKCYMQCCQMLG
jgi:hypothetical protein